MRRKSHGGRAEGETKKVSGRGAFIIGLVLGAGVLFVYTTFKQENLQTQINELKKELDTKMKEAITSRGDEMISTK